MNLQPPKTALSKRFGFGKLEQTTRKIIANMVEVGWNRVSPSTEVEVVR
jgi:hypothetical protein